MTSKILIHGDSKEKLKQLTEGSVDFMATDPPYGYSFMGKGWDKVLPDVEIWKESFRVLKEGSFICVMAAPRSDVLWRLCRDLEEAGFDLSFTNIEWVYHSGFPKASDTSKMIDKRGGDEYVRAHQLAKYLKEVRTEKGLSITKVDKDLFDGSTLYSWYEGRPKGIQLPTYENYVRLKEYYGLDDRFDWIFDRDKTNVVDEIPMTFGIGSSQDRHGDTKKITEPSTDLAKKYEGSKLGFQPKPAREIIVVGMKPFKEKSYIDKVLNFEELPENIQRTYPLIQTPKPSKKEKTIGTEKNIHPTIKPIKLMSYLITLFTREGDYVLDPFMGSGTTGLACKLLNRNFIGIDFTEEYFDIAEERLQVSREELIKTLKIKVQGELF